MFTQVELEILSDYFNRQPNLPAPIQVIADTLKERLSGEVALPVDETEDDSTTQDLDDEPTLPGEDGEDVDDEEVIDEASEI